MKRMYQSNMKKVLSALLICAMVVCSFVFGPEQQTASAATANLLNTYGKTLGHVGNCVSLSQLQNASTLAQIKSQYNSVTLENEMKPDYILGSYANLITVAEAKTLGYYIPASYKESYVPRINFNTVDAAMKICYENGLGMRAHTLVWHSQTPSWLFKTGYSNNNGFVSQSVMNSRMEFYIKTVMNHVYNSKYGSCVYAWDIVNEYLHASNSGWLNIYGAVNKSPEFIKRAYTYAYECLEEHGLTNSVSLFFNDYNTYMEANDIITIVKYINSDKKICNGVGMQAHLDTNFPSASQFKTTVQQFVNAGLEVQITEFDVTNYSSSMQATYCYDIMKGVMDIKKAGGNITGFTIWGLYDSISWRSGQTPTLFSSLTTPKESYNKVLQAYTDAGFSVGGTPTVAPTKAPTAVPTKVPTVTTKPTTVPTTKPTVAPTTKPTIAPTTTPSTTTSKTWKFSDSAFGSKKKIISKWSVDGLTLYATSRKPMTMKAGKATLNGVSYTKYLALSGMGNTSYRSVAFDVTGNTKITVVAKSSGTATRYLAICDSNNKELKKITCTSDLASASYTYQGGADTLYLHSTNSGINLFQITIEGTGTQSNTKPSTVPTTAPQTTPAPSVTVAPTPAADMYPEWNNYTIYYNGDVVSYNGKYYISGWWNMAQIPGNSGPWGVWQEYKPAVYPTLAPTKTPTIAPTKTPSTGTALPTPTPATTAYQKMIANSLITTGNNYRVKKAIEKAQNGENVTIAYIGGSITEGANASVNTKCYAYQSYLMFKEAYGKNGGSNVHFVNAGMSGTPSSLGMVRYDRDVLKKAFSKPDIVFVEFAVNDSDDVTNGDAYESLVRNILKADNSPAVILLFSVFQSQWNLQDRFIPVGNYYNLPMVSIKDAVVPEINSGRLSNSDFFSYDGWHPTDNGHKIMADCIKNCFYQISCEEKAATDITIPSSAKIGKSFEGIQMIDSASKISGVTVNAGGFSSKDSATGSFLFDYTSKFANTWMHATTGSSTSFNMNLTCKNLVFIYKLSNSSNTGSVDIYIDGSLAKTVSGYSSNGWNNPQTIVLMNNNSSASHKVEIKMSNGNAAKEFTILGFGFTK